MALLDDKFDTKRLRWLLAELTVVILGILIAFQVEEWRNFESDREEERIGLVSLLRDLEIEKAQIEETWMILSGNRDKWLSMLELISNPEIQTEEEIVSRFERYRTRAWEPTTAAYTSISESNRLSLISDSALQKMIVNYFDVTQTRYAGGRRRHISDVREYLDFLLLDFDFIPDTDFVSTRDYDLKLTTPPEDFPSHPSLVRVIVDLDLSFTGMTQFNNSVIEQIAQLTQEITNHLNKI